MNLIFKNPNCDIFFGILNGLSPALLFHNLAKMTIISNINWHTFVNKKVGRCGTNRLIEMCSDWILIFSKVAGVNLFNFQGRDLHRIITSATERMKHLFVVFICILISLLNQDFFKFERIHCEFTKIIE